ncbi:MAG: hypothetical protein AAFX05_12165, partial [Planctomycetota bacterium]
MTISWGRTLHLVSALALGLLLLVSPQAAGQTSTGVDVAVESFGVGGAVRPGEWAGIRLLLTDSATRPRMVAVRFHPHIDPRTQLDARIERHRPLEQGRVTIVIEQ